MVFAPGSFGFPEMTKDNGGAFGSPAWAVIPLRHNVPQQDLPRTGSRDGCFSRPGPWYQGAASLQSRPTAVD